MLAKSLGTGNLFISGLNCTAKHFHDTSDMYCIGAQGEWQGAWSDNDPRWTEQMQRELNFKKGFSPPIFIA